MTYHPLDEKTLVDYIKSRPAMKRIFPKDEP